MKITKSRLLEIIREEVELHEKRLEENTFELEEMELDEEEVSKKEFDAAIKQDQEKEVGNIDEVEKVKHKGKTYKASDATMKAIRGGAGGPGKVTPAEFKKAADQAKNWADNPDAVAAAGRIIAKKKAGTMDESDVGEEKLFSKEKDKEGQHPEIEPETNSRKVLSVKIR